jgi:large subunit ribosomal protein L22
MITAKLNNYRQSPRKVRLVTDLVKGKRVDQALDTLTILDKRASSPIRDLVMSAVANAKHNFNLEKDVLYVKEFRVDGGVVLRRRMPRARGTAYPINKRTSHITLILAPKEIEAKEVKTKAKVKSTTKK